MSGFEFTVPLPPSANNLFANAKGGRVKTGEYRAWTEEAGWHARTAWANAGKPKLTGPLQLTLRVGADRRRDVSNCIKAVEDMIVSCVPGMPDDRWNDIVTATRAPTADGLAHVSIREMQPHLNKGRGR